MNRPCKSRERVTNIKLDACSAEPAKPLFALRAERPPHRLGLKLVLRQGAVWMAAGLADIEAEVRAGRLLPTLAADRLLELLDEPA